MAITFVPRWLAVSALATCLAVVTAAPAPAATAPTDSRVASVVHRDAGSAESPRLAWNLISGQPITSGATQCTLGFNARASSGARFVLASGHCVGSSAADWYGVGGYIGPGAGSSFPGNDFGRIYVASTAAVSTALIDRYASGSDLTISGVVAPSVRLPVCSSSPITGWQCGTVTGVNQTVCYPQGCVSQLARSTLCGSPGAPVVTDPAIGVPVRAVGLISNTSGNCTSGGTSFIQPISEPLLAYGLTLW